MRLVLSSFFSRIILSFMLPGFFFCVQNVSGQADYRDSLKDGGKRFVIQNITIEGNHHHAAAEEPARGGGGRPPELQRRRRIEDPAVGGTDGRRDVHGAVAGDNGTDV